MNLILAAVQLLVAGTSASFCGLEPGECGGPAPAPVAPHHPAAAHHRRRHSSSSDSGHCCGGCPFKRGPHRAKLLGQLYIDALIENNQVQLQSLQIPNMPSEQFNLCWDSDVCCKSPYPFGLQSYFSPPARPYQLTPVEFVEELADHSVIVQSTLLFYGPASLISSSWQVQMKWSWMPDCEMKLSLVVGVDVPCIGKAGFGSNAPLPVTSVCAEGCTQNKIITATTTTTTTTTTTVTVAKKVGFPEQPAGKNNGITEPTPAAR